MVWWLASWALAQPCADRGPLLRGLEDAVTAGAINEAEMLESRLVEAFGCGLRASPDELASFWLARAARRYGQGALDDANLALRSARRLSDAFDDRYGIALARRWNDAHTSPILPSRIEVETREPTFPLLLVDGLPFQPPGFIEAGLHLVQWGRSEDDVAGARIVRTEPDQTTILDVPYLAALEPPPGPAGEPRAPRRRSPAFLVVAGITGVGALVTAGLAATTGPSVQDAGADAGDALARRFDGQRALGLTSYGLMAASTLSLGIHILR